MVRTWALLFTGCLVWRFGAGAQQPPPPPAVPFAMAAQPAPPPPPRPAKLPKWRPWAREDDDRLYERGQRALDKGAWDEALERFGEVAARGGSRSDGALYWKAYALSKLRRRDEALAVLEQLRKSNTGSRWLDDAQALEVEVRQAAGQPVTPESESNEEIKLMAINSLMHSDPERVVPLLEKLLKGSQSPKLKERTLFVLTQSGSPRAREVLVQMARGGTNPDLQMKAIQYLAVGGGKDSLQVLSDAYAASGDVNIKRTILRSFMAADDRERLFNAAKGEKTPELRREAVRQLGAMHGQSELAQLYQSESSAEIKEEIVHAMFVSGNLDKLAEIARTEKDPKLRNAAIHNLGISGAKRTGDALASMYAADTDPAVRREIINALSTQQNAKALVEVARKEGDPEIKKEIVRKLTHMKSKEATDFLMELLNR